MPTCLVVQHVAAEPAFSIDEALLAAGVTVDTRRVFRGDDIPPDTAGFDGLVVMGGPMSVNSTEDFPSREAEVSLLADAVRVGIPTLGVCLGAQLLAVAAGGAVARNTYGPKIGWAPIHLDPACPDDRLLTGLPPTLTVLHWHGESFEVPPGARPLINGTTYPNQAFRIGDVAWGVQFHLEVTAEAVDRFLQAFAAEAASVPGGAEAVRAATPAALSALATARDLVCSRFAGLVAARVAMGDLVDLESDLAAIEASFDALSGDEDLPARDVDTRSQYLDDLRRGR
jgi:GMP synthase-like glutamine amidotransferase